MNAVTALLWERWRRTRWAVITVTLAPLSGWMVAAAGYLLVGRLVTLSFWFLGTLVLAGVLLFGQCELRSLNLGFPNRLFRLPVRTVTLLAVYLGFGVAAVTLPFLSIPGFVTIFGGSFENGWTALLIVVTGFVWLQTLAWLKGARAVFFFLIPSLTGGLILLYLAANYLLILETKIICPAIILLCCGISYWNVSADRRGSWESGWQWVSFLSSLFRRSHAKNFASALHAQTWFETRMAGYFFPIAVLGFAGPALGWKIAGGVLFGEDSPSALASYQSIRDILRVTMIAAWLGGALSYAVYHRDRKSGASSFWLRRPMPTWMLAHARLKAMILSLANTLGILTVTIAALFSADWLLNAQAGFQEFIPQSLQNGTFLETALVAVLTLLGLALVCWALLELPRAVFIVIIGLEITWAGVWVYFGGNVARTIDFWASGFVRWAACVAAAGLMIITLWISFLARRRKLISTKTLARMACAFPAVTAALCALGLWIGVIDEWPGLMEGVYIFGAASVPFIPLLAEPLSIDKQRHQ